MIISKDSTPEQKEALRQALRQQSLQMAVKGAAPEDIQSLPEDFEPPSYSENTRPLYDGQLFPKITSADDLIANGYATPDGQPTEQGKMAISLKKVGALNDDYTLNDTGRAMLMSQDDLFEPENLNAYAKAKDLKLDGEDITFTESVAELWGKTKDLARAVEAEIDPYSGAIKAVGSLAAGPLGLPKVIAGAAEQVSEGLPSEEERAAATIRRQTAVEEFSEQGVQTLLGAGELMFKGALGARATTPFGVTPEFIEEAKKDQAILAASQARDRVNNNVQKVSLAEAVDDFTGLTNLVGAYQEAESILGPEKAQEAVKQGEALGLAASIINPAAPEAIAFGVGARVASKVAAPFSGAVFRAEQKAAQVLDKTKALASLQKQTAEYQFAARAAEQRAIQAEQTADKLSKAGFVERANNARNVANRIRMQGQEAGQKLGSLQDEMARVSDDLAVLSRDATVADKMVQLTQKAKELPFKSITGLGKAIEYTGRGMIGIDKGLSNLAAKIGADKAYNAMNKITTLSGLGGVGVASGLGPAAFIPAAIKTAWSTAPFIKATGEYVGMLGREAAKARGQIGFWKRVYNMPNQGFTQNMIAGLADTATLGGNLTGLGVRTGKGILASVPADLAFQYVAEGGDMDIGSINQALAESVFFGGTGAALGGITMGSKNRIRSLQNGDALNFYRSITDGNQRVMFNAMSGDMKRAIGTFSASYPGSKILFSNEGAGSYDRNTKTLVINPNSRNPLKPLLTHEFMHHILNSGIGDGIVANLIGDGYQTGGILRNKDGSYDAQYEQFKTEYVNDLRNQHEKNVRLRDAIGDPMTKSERVFQVPDEKYLAEEYFIESNVDDMLGLVESGKLGKMAGRMIISDKMRALGDAILNKSAVLKDLHFRLGGVMDSSGKMVTGNGFLGGQLYQSPEIRRMFKKMVNESVGRKAGIDAAKNKARNGIEIQVTGKKDPILASLDSLWESDGDVPLVDKNGDYVPLKKETEELRSTAGLLLVDDLQKRQARGDVFEPGELAYNPENNTWSGSFLTDNQIKLLKLSGRFSNVQIKQLELLNAAAKTNSDPNAAAGTRGNRFSLFYQPALKKNRKGQWRYDQIKPQLRDVVPYGVEISKDGNILIRIMSTNQLFANAAEKAATKRGRLLYEGNIDAILQDANAMIDAHGKEQKPESSDRHFKDKYGAKWEDHKKFINSVFGNVGAGHKDINPLVSSDRVDAVVKSYRLDRINKATQLVGATKIPYQNNLIKINYLPEGEPILDANGEPKDLRYTPRIEDRPEQRQMPEGVDLSPEDLNPIANRQEAEGLFADGKRIFAFHEMDEKLFEITSLDVLKRYPPDSMGWMEPDTEPTGQMRFMPESEKATPAEVLQELDSTNFIPRKMAAKILGPFPEYLTPVADFIAKQREKLVSGTITPRDVWKAYAMTVASQGTGAVSVDLLRDKLAKVGIDFNPTDLFTDTGKSGQRTIRPEEAAAYWLGTPEGKRALDNAESGNTSPSDWDGLVQVRKAYGDDRFKTFNVFSDKNLSKIPVVVDQLNQSKGNSKKVLDAVQLLNGVSTGKKGFISHLLGLGNTPTIDAVEINFWLTGKGDVGTLKTKEADLARKIKDTFSDKRVREEMFNRVDNSINLLRDVAEGGKKVPKEVWSHVMHHWLWDKAKGLETTHAGMYEAQMRFMPDGDVGENSRYATPPSEETARDAISTSKRPFWGKHRNLEDGEKIGVRIDIPAFLSKGVYVQTVHEPATPGNVGDRIGYDTHVRLKNGIKFFVKEGSAESKLGAVAIKEGRANKHPIATVEGSYSKDRTIPKDINSWTAVGMNPDKHSYFYDKRTGEPVIGGEESYSVGNTVFVKNPVYGNKSDFRFMPEPLPANYQSSRDTTFLYQSIGPDGIVNLTRPIKSTEALPTVSTRHEYPVEDFTVSKLDKRASILYTTNKNGEPVTFKFDPQLMNKPEFADFDDLYDGAVVQLAMADRHGATDGDMGGHAFPDLKVNQDFIVDDGNGKKYKLVWSNNAWGPVKNMSTKAQKYGATTLLTYNMDPHAHDSNTRTVRIFSNEIANSGLSQVDQSTLLIVMNVALKKAQSSASKQDLRAFLKDKKDIVESLKKDDKIKAKSSSGNAGLSVAERDALLLSLDDIQKQIDDENKFLKESLGVKLAGDEEVKVDALFRNYQNKRRAYEKTPTSEAKKKAMVDAEKELKKYQKTKEFKKAEGLLPSRELDKFSNTFKGRKSLILAIKNKEASVKWHGFDSQKISQIIGDQLTGDSLHIVSSVELSQDPDFKAVYLGDDPREIARMSPQEKKAAQQLKSNPDFVPHEAYLWSMLGPAESKHTYNTNQRSVLESFPDFINEYSQLPVKPGKLKLNDPNSKASEFNIVNTIRDQSKIRIVFRAAKGRND